MKSYLFLINMQKKFMLSMLRSVHVFASCVRFMSRRHACAIRAIRLARPAVAAKDRAMSIRLFKTFLAVARYGSFAGAAQEIGLTQAAVSIQMRALETHLHRALFDRNARTAVLNRTGRALVPRAQALIEHYDNIAHDIDAGQPGGALSLGAIPPTFARLLPDALLWMRQHAPGITVQVANGVSAELMRRVDAGDLDAAIVSQPPFKLAPAMHWRTITAEPLVLITPAATPAASLVQTLARQPYIALTRSSWSGQLVHGVVRRHRLKVNQMLELDSLEAITAMVARGVGVSILPLSPYIRALGAQLRVARLVRPGCERAIGLIQRRGQDKAALVDILHAALMVAPDEPATRMRQLSLTA